MKAINLDLNTYNMYFVNQIETAEAHLHNQQEYSLEKEKNKLRYKSSQELTMYFFLKFQILSYSI